jgi:hypothetical protein
VVAPPQAHGAGGPTPGESPAVATPASLERLALNEQAQGNLEGQTRLKKEAAQQAATDTQKLADATADQKTKIGEAIAAGNKYVSDAQAHIAEKTDAYQEALAEDKDHTVFTGKSTWQKIGAYLGMALGAIGAGFSAAGGHPTGNMAATTLLKLADDDFQKQRSRIADLKDSVAMAQTGLKDAKDAKQALMYDVLAKQDAVYKTLEAQARANAAGLGVKAADLEGSDLMTQLKQRQLETEDAKKRQAQQDYLTRLKTHAEVAKDYAEAEGAKATADYHKALASGQIGPGGVNINLKLNSAVENAVDKDAPTKAYFKKAAEMEGVDKALASGNAVEIGGAIDGLVKAQTGLGARKQMIEILQHRLGGTEEQILGKIQGWATGNEITPEMVKKLRSAAGDIKTHLAEEGASHRKRLEGGLKSNPAFKGHEDTVGAVLDQKFGTGEPAAPAPSAPQLTPAQITRIKAIPASDPDYARAQKMLKDAGAL